MVECRGAVWFGTSLLRDAPPWTQLHVLGKGIERKSPVREAGPGSGPGRVTWESRVSSLSLLPHLKWEQ